MALSYYSNWAALQQLNQEMTTISSTNCDLLPPELLNFDDSFLDTCIDPLFIDQNNLIFYPNNDTYSDISDIYSGVSPLSVTPLNTLPPLALAPAAEVFEPSYSNPKRVKTEQDSYYNLIQYDPFLPNPPLIMPEFTPELVISGPEFQTTSSGAVYEGGSRQSSNVKKQSGGSLSAQSIAARVRRRKITEKTQELGKLIPDGHKMNTAEMFEAASKYIKFLQAQFHILEFMSSSHQENEEDPFHSPELQALVTSPVVQEKLCSAEKCLVPRKFVEALLDKPELQFNPQLKKDILQLL